MSPRNLEWLVAAALVIPLTIAKPAAAVELHTNPVSIHQKGTTAQYTVGHFIDASTSFQNLVVSGSFNVTCQYPGVPPVNYEVTQSQTVLGGRNVLSMAVPLTLPATRSVSGWADIPTGTVFSCTYDYQSRAVESGINFGTGGGSLPIGNGTRSDRDTIVFDMLKVGGFPGPGCIF